EVEPQRAGDLLHRLDLRVAAHARDGDADVDGRAHAGEEQVGFKVDLAVGDGDHVRGDVGGNVAFLGLDDGKRGERTAAVLVGELGGAFEQAAVKVEDVAGVGLAAGRTAKQQGELPVGGRLLAEVVVDAQDVLALPHEVFAHGAAGVGGDVL